MGLSQRLGSAIARAVIGADRVDASANARRSDLGYSLTVPDYQFGKPTWGDSNIGEYRKAFAAQVAVYACVLARARAVSSAPLRVYSEVKGTRTELPTHPLRALLAQPNEAQSEAEFVILTQTMMDATGFAAIQKVRNAAGQVISLWHLRSDWMREVKRRNNPSDWEYRIPSGRVYPLKASEVIIIAGGPATDLGTTGLSPIAVALREAKIDAALTDYLKMFLDRGAVPRHALVTNEVISDTAYAEELKAAWQAAYGGTGNWSNIALLTGGVTAQKLQSDLDELAYPDLRFLTEAHICAVFGVPPIVANMQVGLAAATYSNYEQARKAFFEDTVKSLWDRLDGAMTRGLLLEFDATGKLSLEFDTSQVPALSDDADQVWSRATESLRSGGMTLNQYQSALGMPGFGDAGDVLYLPLGVEPLRPDDLATLADMTAEPPQPIPAALVAGPQDDETPSLPAGDEDDEEDDRARRADRRVRTLPLETRARIGSTNRRNINRLTSRWRGRMITTFRKQGDLVAAAYGKRALDAAADAFRASLSDAEPDMRSGILADYVTRSIADIPWDEIDALTERELTNLYRASGQLSWLAAGNAVGVDMVWDLSNPKIRQVLGKLATRIVAVGETTRAGVRAVIAESAEAGLSVAKTSEALRGLFVETYRNRALTIARTESQVSYNLATDLAYLESNIVLNEQLLDNPDHDEDYGAADGLSCAERNGLVIEVGEAEFHVMAEHPNGTLTVTPLLVRPLGEE